MRGVVPRLEDGFGEPVNIISGDEVVPDAVVTVLSRGRPRVDDEDDARPLAAVRGFLCCPNDSTDALLLELMSRPPSNSSVVDGLCPKRDASVIDLPFVAGQLTSNPASLSNDSRALDVPLCVSSMRPRPTSEGADGAGARFEVLSAADCVAYCGDVAETGDAMLDEAEEEFVPTAVFTGGTFIDKDSLRARRLDGGSGGACV